MVGSRLRPSRPWRTLVRAVTEVNPVRSVGHESDKRPASRVPPELVADSRVRLRRQRRLELPAGRDAKLGEHLAEVPLDGPRT
jgi:hypothetical protein